MAKGRLLRRPLAPSKNFTPSSNDSKNEKLKTNNSRPPALKEVSHAALIKADRGDGSRNTNKVEEQLMGKTDNEFEPGAPTPHTSYVEDTSIVGNKLMQSLNLEDIEFVKEAGPDPLPSRRYVKPINPATKLEFYKDDSDALIRPKPIFTLDDFKLNSDKEESRKLTVIARTLQLSKKNYDEMVAIFARDYKHTVKPKKVTVDDIDLPMVRPPRRPYKQLKIESKQGKLEEYIRKDVNTSITGSTITVTRNSTPWKLDVNTESEYMSNLSPAKYNQDENINQPLLAMEGNMEINPSEAAVLNCMIESRGTSLSLKAYFISNLPNLTPIFQTLRWLNLSFNNFSEFPTQLFQLKYLEVLYLRNNPIQDLPKDIYRLSNLKTLGVSHCLLQSLPESVYEIKGLEHLDFSYNRISEIHRNIGQLHNLRIVNLEGNEIIALPCDVMNLDLKHLYIANNYIHPLFWANYIKNDPQPLKDVAAIVFSQSELELRYPTLPENIKEALKKQTQCMCCGGPMYGDGLKVIRPAGRMFGVHTLPLIFRSCSPYCRVYYNQVAESLIYRAMND